MALREGLRENKSNFLTALGIVGATTVFATGCGDGGENKAEKCPPFYGEGRAEVQPQEAHSTIQQGVKELVAKVYKIDPSAIRDNRLSAGFIQDEFSIEGKLAFRSAFHEGDTHYFTGATEDYKIEEETLLDDMSETICEGDAGRHYLTPDATEAVENLRGVGILLPGLSSDQ
jgi:hypothetical protein